MKQFLTSILFGLLLYCHVSFAVLSQAPEINLPGMGEEVQLENLKGNVIYLDFWASWCKPCSNSFPWMREMKQRYANKGFEIIAINLDKDKKLADNFLKNMDINFKIAFDQEGKSAANYKLKGMPNSFLIGRDGMIRASHVGFREKDKAELEQAIVELLKQ